MIKTLIFSLVIWAMSITSHATQNIDEYGIKARFLYSFLKYTKFSSNNDTYRIAVIGKNPFHGQLKALKGKKIHGKEVHVSFLNRNYTNLNRYHLVFFSKSLKHSQQEILSTIGNQTLTVGDNKWFIQSGGAINLVFKKRKVTFSMNHKKIDRDKYKVSSKLRRLSTNKR